MPGKCFKHPSDARALQPAHINRCVAEHFARRAPERTRVKTVREFAALFGNDRHHGRKVDVEAEHRAATRPKRGPVYALRPRSPCWRIARAEGIGGKTSPQTIDQSAFLIDSAKRHRGNQTGDNHPAICASCSGDSTLRPKIIMPPGFNLFDEFARFFVDFRSRQPDEEELSDLLFERQRREMVIWHG